MPGGVGEHQAVAGVGLELVAGGTGGQHPGFGDGEVVDRKSRCSRFGEAFPGQVGGVWSGTVWKSIRPPWLLTTAQSGS